MKSKFIPILIVVVSISLLIFAPRHLWAQNKNGSESNISSENNYYLKNAKRYFGLNDFTKAIDALGLALVLEPNNAEAQRLLKESRQLLEEKNVPLQAAEAGAGLSEKIAAPMSPHKDISMLLQDAYAAIEGEQYDDALQIIEVILAIDSIHKEALYIKGKVNDIKHQRITENLKTTHEQEKLKSHEYLRDSAIPHQETLRFPLKEQWEDISKRTLPELDKVVEENERKTEQLRTIPNPEKDTTPKVIEDALNTIISFEFLDTPLRDIIIFIREKTNVNMIVDSDAGNVSITLKLKDVPLRTALKYILPSGYEYVIEGDIIHVYRQKMELRVYDVRDILINLDDKEPLEFDLTAAATTQLSMRRREGARTKNPSERIYDLIEMIVTAVEPSSWSPRASVIGAVGADGQRRTINVPGQGEGSIIARMGQPGDLVIVNSKYVHEQIEDLLASLRSAQNLQVSIEARFITVSDEFLEDIGNNLIGDDEAIDTGAEDITGTISDIANAGLSLNYSILSDLAGFLRAVQESQDSEFLTSPRITLSNTQRGNISVVQTTNYVQSTSVSEGVVTPVIGTIPEGTTFDVRPIVSEDRRYVHLEVTPSVFQIEEIEDFRFSGVGTGTTFSGGTGGSTANIPPDQIIQLPRVNVSQVSVTVCVPDRGTLMIGGLGAITKTHLTTGIPILSDIPVLRRLFSRDQKNHDKANLIILLKPTILIREEHEKKLLSSLSNKKNNIIHTNKKSKKNK